MRVLLVEDDRDLAHGLPRALKREDYAADWVADGVTANAVLKTEHFDLIVLDLSLPGLDGMEVLKRLRDRGSQVPVMVLTGFAVQVAHTRGERELLMQEITLKTAWRLVLLVTVAALVFWFGIHRGLAPLALLEREIRSHSPKDLHPLESEVPREIRHLVAAIDQLMARLGASLVRMRHFISDASHQLRTPLAALQTEIELAQEETDPEALRAALARLHANTKRTSRLADQLLSHARATADSGTVRKNPLNLEQLAAAVTRDSVPAAIERGIDLGFESPGQAPWILGDNLLLRELLKNLIDNALRYCPQGAQVTVRVLPGSEPGWVRLENAMIAL